MRNSDNSRGSKLVLSCVIVPFFSLIIGTSALADGLQGDMALAQGDDAAAIRAYRDGAAMGEVSSMSALGTLYDIGRGVRQDYAVALGWYRRAAEAGDVRAMFNVAAMYDSGRGTEADRAEAIRWYTLAARQNYGRAAYNLGVIYRDGDGVARNPAMAIQYFRIADTAGIRAARANLIALGVAGRPGAAPAAVPRPAAPGPTRDPDALRRFEQAALSRGEIDPAARRAATAAAARLTSEADGGNATAQYRAGYLYEKGIGLGADPVKSYVYYLHAAASSDPGVKSAALRGAAEVGRQLNAEQHAAARELLVAPRP